MKALKLCALCSAPFFAVISAQSQTNFQDLDFEEATLPPIPSGQAGGDVLITSALPGWSASIGNVPVTQILQNNISTGQASIEIYGPNWGPIGEGLFFGEGVIDGNYTVFLQSGSGPPGVGGVNVSISQIGTIPANAQTLEFKAWSFNQNAAFSVSFDGNSLSPVVLSTISYPSGVGSGIPLNLYGINMAPYAGQTGQLEFTSIFNNLGESSTEFDDIAFSPIAVTPEPDPLILTGLGGACFAFYRWCRRRKSS